MNQAEFGEFWAEFVNDVEAVPRTLFTREDARQIIATCERSIAEFAAASPPTTATEVRRYGYQIVSARTRETFDALKPTLMPEEQFASFWSGFQPTARRIAENMLVRYGGADLAEDIVQECYYRVWRGSSNPDSLARLKAYAIATVRNRAVDKMREITRHGTVTIDAPVASGGEGGGDTWIDLLPDDSVDILDTIIRQETSERVRRALETLEPRYRAVLERQHGREMTMREIADDLNQLGLEVLRRDLPGLLPSGEDTVTENRVRGLARVGRAKMLASLAGP
jgi:RNA polymerase sigma factor (sigma-70 family)